MVVLGKCFCIEQHYLDVSTKLCAAHCFIKSLHAVESNYAMMFIDFKQLIELREICDQVIDVQRLAIIGSLNNVKTTTIVTNHAWNTFWRQGSNVMFQNLLCALYKSRICPKIV